jgi:signal transduction histidine kinase
MAVVSVFSGLVGCIWLVLAGGSERLMRDWVIHNGIVAVGFGVIVWLVIRSQPRNAAIWVLAWTALSTGLFCLAVAASHQQLLGLGLERAFYSMTPSEFPNSVALLLNLSTWLYFPLFFAFSIAWLLFPDGRPPSPRWRWLNWAMVISVLIAIVSVMWAFRPSGTVVYSTATDTEGTFRDLGVVAGLASFAMIGLIPVCIAGLVVRFRRSSGQERMQFRWVVWAAVVSGVVMLPAITYSIVTRVDSVRWPMAVALVLLIGSYGVAIGRYRLYDVDLVISKTFVYGTLAIFITAVYIAIVVGIGYLVGAHDEPSPWLGIIATVVIAIAFQPLRRQLQRAANRIVYGRRATPYEVLSAFAQRVDAVDPDVLSQIARSLVEGTTASAASVLLRRGEGLTEMASWSNEPGGKEAVQEQSSPIVHDGEELGILKLAIPSGQPFPDPDRHLLDQVAAGLGLALRNLLLTEDLRARVEQLRESRKRIVTVQDHTRRRLERDLHDGAQQRLVALKIKIGIARTMAGAVGLDDVREVLDALRSDADFAIDAVRDFARGIYPPLLESDGLSAALTPHVRSSPIPTSLEVSNIGRYSREIEATVYFCVLEGLQNAIRHSNATAIAVTLEEVAGELSFSVRDDGTGFDPSELPTESGLINLVDRLDAIAGSLVVETAPGLGTTVVGRIPIVETVSS